MRIAFNAQRLAGQRLGVGRYIEYMLRHWAGLLRDGEDISLFVRQPLEPDLSGLHPRIRPVLLRSRLSGIPWENIHLPGAAAGHDVLFCPAYSGPWRYRGRTVVATHSVNEAVPGLHTWMYRQTYARLFRHCARQATRVIVPSIAIQEAVIAHYGVDAGRVVVIPQGADDAFKPVTDVATLRAVRTRFFGADRPYLLFVGKASARRNIPMLVRAFAELRHTHRIPHGLLLFGPQTEGLPLADLCRELGVATDVVQTDGKVEHHTDLVPIYGAADVFVHPSELEGWSITTVEAMACGTPVIAADRGGLGEITRGHALTLETPSVDALVDAIRRVLSDDQLREDLKRRSRARGLQLGWSAITARTLDVVREVGAGGAD